MKTNDEIFNEIKDKFDECPEVPERLTKKNVVTMLSSVQQEKTKKVSIRKISAVAAAVVVVLLCGAVAGSSFGDVFVKNLNDEILGESQMMSGQATTTIANTVSGNNESAQENAPQKTSDGALRKAQSREEVESIILKNYSQYIVYDVYNSSADNFLADGAIGITAAPAVDSNNMATTSPVTAAPLKEAFGNEQSGASKEHGQTNVQTLDVDEADIIKNDGRYLYVVGYDLSNNRKIRIIDTQTMKAVYNGYLYNDSGDILDISEIYVSGNTLVAVGTYGNNNYYTGCFIGGYGTGGKTVSVVMDITDRASPKTLRKVEQDGSYRSSRMVGGVIYTLTEYTVSGKDEEEAKNNSIPEVAGAEIKCDCIYIMDETANRYICLTAYDTSKSESEVSSVAVLGQGSMVYCSQNNFYVIGNKHINRKENKDVDIYTYSVISAFSLNGTSITFSSQGEVKGSINNQYNLDEYQGNLRIATTAYDSKNSWDVSSLYVLDSEMKIIGQVEDIAKDEQIKSVRYMGDKAYVVTFRNTDPLFVIDLKDPTNPKIKGELKLPGYSAYMHPISENIILGIGYNGDSQNADFTSLKVSLFDVSDMANPKEISTLTYNDCYSYVVDNPKAFIYNSQENYMVLPLQKYSTYDYDLSGYSCYIVSVKDNKLTLMHDLKHEVQDVYSGITFLRGTYIGDEFFTVSDNLTVKHSLTNGKKLGECRIYAETQKLETTTAAPERTTDSNGTGEVYTTTAVAGAVKSTLPYNPDN